MRSRGPLRIPKSTFSNGEDVVAMDWDHPRWWLWLWASPLLVGFWGWAFWHRRRSLEQFAEAALLPELTDTVHVARRWFRVAAATIVLVLLLAALAGPQWGFQWQKGQRPAVDIFIALDVSNSMLAEDVTPNRLERAKLAVRDLLEQLQGERVGLIAFAGSSFISCPLTEDYEAFKLTLAELSVKTISRGSTGLEQVVKYSLSGFLETESSKRFLIIFSDGEAHFGIAQDAAKLAVEKDLIIHTVGVGTTQGELIPIKDGQGGRTFLKDREGRTVKTRLQEDSLKTIAAVTGGSYIRNTTDPRWLEIIYGDERARMEIEMRESSMHKQPRKRFQWFLVPALLLLVLEALLQERRRAMA